MQNKISEYRDLNECFNIHYYVSLQQKMPREECESRATLPSIGEIHDGRGLDAGSNKLQHPLSKTSSSSCLKNIYRK